MSKRVQDDTESILETKINKKGKSKSIHYIVYRLIKFKLNRNINHLKNKKNDRNNAITKLRRKSKLDSIKSTSE
jgi:hypothetical protein